MFENIYEKTNPEMFSKLKIIVEQHPNIYTRILQGKKYLDIYNWIDNVTKQYLKNHLFSEKIYWIMNNITSWKQCLCENCKQPKNFLKTKNNISINRCFISLKHGYSRFCSLKCVGESENVKLARINSNIEKFGCKNPFQNEKIKLKIEKTKFKCYGNENFNNRNKAKQTCLNRYGVSSPVKTRNVILKLNKHYIYRNIAFPSSWELAFYIWLSDNNIKFEYQPDLNLKYIDENTHKERKYFPDFMILNTHELIEIKGDYFFQNGKPIYRNKTWINKYNCMLKHNVKIFKKKDIKKYLDYVKMKYGKNFLKKFRNK